MNQNPKMLKRKIKIYLFYIIVSIVTIGVSFYSGWFKGMGVVFCLSQILWGVFLIDGGWKRKLVMSFVILLVPLLLTSGVASFIIPNNGISRIVDHLSGFFSIFGISASGGTYFILFGLGLLSIFGTSILLIEISNRRYENS